MSSSTPGYFEQTMILNKKEVMANRIPIWFVDGESQAPNEQNGPGRDADDDATPPSDEMGYASTDDGVAESQVNTDDGLSEDDKAGIPDFAELDETDTIPFAGDSGRMGQEDDSITPGSPSSFDEGNASSQGSKMPAGPMLAELIATRAELRRVETERNDLLERLARRQADFENYRKRVERERGESFQRMVGDVVGKLFPVMDNMRRALEAESLLEKDESAEFRHFLRGVELIYKQLNDALVELGVEPVPSVGQPFDPHLHEAVATEHSDDYEPDTVTQELLRGYRLGEKLLRPAMVKVSTKQ